MMYKEMLKAAYLDTGSNNTLAEAAAGLPRQSIAKKSARDSLKATEFLKILDGIGVDIVLINRKTGSEILPVKSCHGKRMRRMAGGRFYDTGKARPVAHRGNVELFVTPDGKFFFADYEKGKIRVAEPDVAASFEDANSC